MGFERNQDSISYSLVHALRLLRTSVSIRDSDESQRTIRRLLRVLVVGLQRPVFIIGAPRSGTSFLGKCIAKLPDIAYFREPGATKFAISQLGENRWPEWLTAYYHALAYRLLLWGHATDENPRFAEKTPRNCFFVRFLKESFPSAVFIHIIRDGRDVALSLSRKPWLVDSKRDSQNREPGGYSYGPYPRFWVEDSRREEFRSTSDIHRCIWSWRRHVESALNASEYLSSDEYLELRYEELCRNPTMVGKSISNFLGVKVSRESKFFEKSESASTSSIGNYKDGLTMKQKDEIDEEAGSLLRFLGYR